MLSPKYLTLFSPKDNEKSPVHLFRKEKTRRWAPDGRWTMDDVGSSRATRGLCGAKFLKQHTECGEENAHGVNQRIYPSSIKNYPPG